MIPLFVKRSYFLRFICFIKQNFIDFCQQAQRPKDDTVRMKLDKIFSETRNIQMYIAFKR